MPSVCVCRIKLFEFDVCTGLVELVESRFGGVGGKSEQCAPFSSKHSKSVFP